LTIICFKDGVMAADAQQTAGDLIVGYARKIWRYADGTLAGGCGISTKLWRFHHTFAKAPFDFKTGDQIDVSGFGKMEPGDFTMLLVKPDGRRFIIFWDGDVREYSRKSESGPMAIGQGQEYALGVMDAGMSAAMAVRLTCKRFTGCGGRIQSMRV
jgi:ATP-dependent protease HslVU (ClpYQ) peptidase subunit